MTCYVRGADQNTQVQLFSLASGSPTLIGTMNDTGQNGDQKAGDQVYTIATTITVPAAASLPMQVVASPGASVNFSVQVVQIPSYTTNTDVNQAESQLYNSAIQTRTSFSSPDWSKQTLLQGISSNLTSMFGQLSGVVSQNSVLQTAAVRRVGIPGAATPEANSPQPNGIGQDILNILTFGLLSPAQNASSCNQLVESLGGFRSSYPNALSLDDPQLQDFAQELTSICTTAASCQGAFGINDFLSDNVAAAEWAHEYVTTGQPLPTAIAGCGGGVTQSVANVAVTDGVSQYTDLAGDGLSGLTGGGQIAQSAVSQTGSTLLEGWLVNGSGTSTVVVVNTGSNATFAAPAGTYNMAVSFGADTANATITNTPVYPNSVTNISPSSGATITVTPPYVTGLTPAIGAAGTAVVVTGTGFDPTASNNEVTFNGTSAQVDSATITSIQASVPAGASSGPVSVTNSSGSTTSSLLFTVTGNSGNPPPAITSLFPNTATAGATSQLLSIKGTGFVLSSTVTFNGVLHQATFLGTNLLAIKLTSSDLATAGAYPVAVTNPGLGGTSSAVSFTVTSAPPAGAGEWTWMTGSSVFTTQYPEGLPGDYGTLDDPTMANTPGGKTGALSWTDSVGNFWLFGGYGQTNYYGTPNDLWEFNRTSGMWTWMNGSSGVNNSDGYTQPGNYGTQGVPAVNNVPGGRENAVSWTDSEGNLWLFGGQPASSSLILLNDLWEFNTTTMLWTWISGSNSENQPGVYGTQNVAAATNVPGARAYAVSWTDGSGDLWLFGGTGFASAGTNASLNDLWLFNPKSLMWTWVSGSSTGNQAGVYGTQGVPASTNIPGGRQNAVSWTDSNGNLWLFGGAGLVTATTSGGLNDLWKFNPASKTWMWVSGSSTLAVSGGSQPGVYGTQGVPSAGNVPGGRVGAVGWTDGSGNLWLFGGDGSDSTGKGGILNDLWEFSPVYNMWTWASGSSTLTVSGSGQPGLYGVQGTAAAANVPGARTSAVSWTDGNGNLWLFGGSGYTSDGVYGYLNDLWRYQP